MLSILKTQQNFHDRVVNFYAGPGALPLPVLRKVHDEFFNFEGTGMSVMELSHRSDEIIHIIADSIQRIKRLVGLTDEFEIIFLQGGGSLQFLMAPMNFSKVGDSIDYIDTGYWSMKAIKAAQELKRDLKVIASTEDNDHTSVPDLNKISTRHGSKYLHLCSNNTVVGTQFHSFPVMPIPVVADMSSDFMSKPMNLENLDLVYAHAQKNVGLSGVTVVMIRKEMLSSISENSPEFLDYRTHIKGKSNYHTPPCFSIYITWKILQWIEEDIGGLKELGKINQKKASLLYDFIDSTPLFHCPVERSARSQMNVVFNLPNENLEKQFIHETTQAGIIGVAGHRTRGGCRVSLYNGVTVEAVETLVDFMSEFAKQHSQLSNLGLTQFGEPMVKSRA
jgi:phosphoserine aminotransferase